MWRLSSAVSTCVSFKALLHAELGGRKCVVAALLVMTLQEGESRVLKDTALKVGDKPLSFEFHHAKDFCFEVTSENSTLMTCQK